MCRFVLLPLALLLATSSPLLAQVNREEKVRLDRKKVEAEGFWIYNDLPKGIAEARKTGKPMLVILRCIPCEECVRMDDHLVNTDKRVRPLLEKFVCVRVVSTNGLDLSLFQFDYDQSFAAFFLNADGTIYGRFGTRSHRTHWSDDVSIDGLARALEGALELHAGYPKNRAILAAKRGPAQDFPSPERYPALKSRYKATLDYKGKVVPSCIHCHQIGDAQRALYRDRKQPIPEEMLFSYPHPKSQGLILDPRERATVLRVEEGSPAARTFRKGDIIRTLAGQPLLSIADVQWVLHRTSPGAVALKAEVLRGGKKIEVVFNLPEGWRRREDISWRVSSWGLRRMATGGMVVEVLPEADRKLAGVKEGEMALRVKHVGLYGAHAAAKKAGVEKGDILVSFDGQTNFQRETDLLAFALTRRRPGERVAVTLLRGGRRLNLMLPMQN